MSHIIYSRPLALSVMLLLAMLTFSRPVGAQEEHTHEGGDHHEDFHFSHPLIAESVSPDTKIRLDYLFQHRGQGDDDHTMEFEAEYAFHRAFSIEASLPYVLNESAPGHAHAALKFANYAFEERGLLLGYGIEFGLPTGGGHEHGTEAQELHAGDHEHTIGGQEHGGGGDDIYEIEPFLNAGYQWRDWEFVAFTLFGIPTNQSDQENVGTEIGYSISALYHVGPRVQALLEYDGESGLSGPSVGQNLTHLTPGIKVRPLAGSSLLVGLGVSIPLSEEREFDTQALLSAFYHF